MLAQPYTYDIIGISGSSDETSLRSGAIHTHNLELLWGCHTAAAPKPLTSGFDEAIDASPSRHASTSFCPDEDFRASKQDCSAQMQLGKHVIS